MLVATATEYFGISQNSNDDDDDNDDNNNNNNCYIRLHSSGMGEEDC
jgi:hypothetical protein